MQLHHLIWTDYDTALRDAHEQFGDGVRVVFRRDYTEKKLFSSQHRCEVQFYVVAPVSEQR